MSTKISDLVPESTVETYNQLRRQNNVIRTLQLLPASLWIGFFLGGSLLIITIYSFLEIAPPQGALEFTLDNYQLIVDEPFYMSVMLDSFFIAVKTTAVALLLTYPSAYFIAIMDIKYKNFFLILLVLPFWINIVVRTYAWRLVLGPRGVINFVFYETLGVFSQRHDLLFSQNAITVGLIHVFLPFMLLPLYTSLDRIDTSQIEAAKNLGASRIEAFYEVVLPQSLPGVAAGSMIVFILSFGSFVTPLLLGGERNVMIANIIASMFRAINDWAFGSALAMVFVAIILISSIVFNRLVGLNEIYGGSSE